MTESRMENLLRQMSLQEPSIEVDERVTACLRTSGFVEEQGDPLLASRGGAGPAGRDLKSWPVLSVIAVVCLLLGVVLGRVTVVTSMADVAGSVEHRVKAVGSERSPDSDRTFVDEPVVSNLVVDISGLPDDSFRNQFQGPAVAMLCSLGTHSVPDSTRQQLCLQCHNGVTSARSEFRKTHMSMLNSELCSKCHGQNIPEMDSALPQRLWHDVDSADSPTG